MDISFRCLYPYWTQRKTKKRNPIHRQKSERKAHRQETSTEQMDASFVFTPPTPIGGGKPKPIRICSPNSSGASNLKLHVDKMTKQQLEQAIETISEDPSTITIVNNKGNENEIKTEVVETSNTNETNTNNNHIRRSSKLRSNNPIVSFGNPLTH